MWNKYKQKKKMELTELLTAVELLRKEGGQWSLPRGVAQ
jgi:hypothetical protein